jgi:D-alanine transaminase
MNTDLVWLNGNVLPLTEAKISIEDRGYHFADGVYEAARIYNSKLYALDRHFKRLKRSMEGLAFPAVDLEGLSKEVVEFCAKHGPAEGFVYLQVTRGVAPRAHVIPSNLKPNIHFFTHELPPSFSPEKATPVKLLSVLDERWKKCWIKSIGLLANALAKTAAVNAGADEAVFIDEGKVTECGSSNIFMVIDGVLTTHHVGAKVLPGITREILIELAGKLSIPVKERAVSVEEAKAAGEIFLSVTTREVMWVSHWDGKPVGAGKPGEITLKLHRAIREDIVAKCGQ